MLSAQTIVPAGFGQMTVSQSSRETAVFNMAPQGVDSSEKFSGFDGGKELAIKINASQAGDSSNWNAALSVDHEIKIKKTGQECLLRSPETR